MYDNSKNSPKDRLEEVQNILTFLAESLCIGRDLPLSDTALTGAQVIFWILDAEMAKLREFIQ